MEELSYEDYEWVKKRYSREGPQEEEWAEYHEMEEKLNEERWWDDPEDESLEPAHNLYVFAEKTSAGEVYRVAVFHQERFSHLEGISNNPLVTIGRLGLELSLLEEQYDYAACIDHVPDMFDIEKCRKLYPFEKSCLDSMWGKGLQ
jgi:hypothetical protein